ncbi:Arm DNA-binding domain-containing protein [Eupransor demetentiae]|uniref:Includes phage integrase (FimB) n=1 Tax=Eupransor demetentiae TaxID=3109584 RepID=A0ABM9N4R1_9LACO|nr:Integrase/recombinase [Lactobacillaceae bacterium LMG 33000]
MSSEYKRGKTWTSSVVVNVRGEKKRKTKSGFPTKSEARRWGAEQESKRDMAGTNTPIIDLYFEWYEIFKKPNISRETRNWYLAVGHIIRDKWTQTQLDELNAKEFQKFINDYGRDHVLSSVRRVKNIIAEFVRYCVEEDYISKDFTANTKSVSAKKGKDKNLKFLEYDDMMALIEACKEDDCQTSRMILTSLYTGCRYSEVAALQPTDGTLKMTR